jgi:uncharacterized protein YndB with AHSA1/START domain
MTEHEGRAACVVIVERTYDAPIEDLWDAITSLERLPNWFLPVSGDLRLGGRYQLEGNAGGEITRCEPPRCLSLTWEFDGGISWLEIRLMEQARGGVRLELKHIAHEDESWDQYGPGAAGVGWDLALLGLALYLSTGFDAKQAEAWQASDEGKAFLVESSEAWCRASIAAGTDEVAARAAANRTRVAYIGEDPDGPSTEATNRMRSIPEEVR